MASVYASRMDMNVPRFWCVLSLLVLATGCGSQLPADVAPNLERARRIRTEIDAGGAGAAAATAVTVEPTGWATLTGTFKIVGTPPVDEPVKPTQDLATCAPGGKAPVPGTMLVSGDGGVANVLVFLTTKAPAEAAEKWEHPDFVAQKDATLTTPFDQKECIFLSRIFPLRSTQSVQVKNSDNVGHNANIQPKGGATPQNFTIPGGQAVLYKPGGAEDAPFPVSCSIHPWMKSWMISRDNPYFAISDASGAFKIENLPAAEGLKLEFRGWHERANFLQNVTVDGEPVAWKKGRFEVELVPGETKNLEITIDASQFK